MHLAWLLVGLLISAVLALGVGLLLAMSFGDDISSRIVSSCVKEGLLLNAVRPNAIRIWPPLTISGKDIDRGLERLERGMQAAMGR